MKFILLCCAFALLILGADAHAQELAPGLRVIPSLGGYLPAGDLGYGRGPEDGPASPAFLNLSRGLAVGLAVEVPVNSIVSLRGGMKYGFASDVVAGSEAGMESCGTDCSIAAYERTPLTSASALLVSTDLAVQLAPASWPIRPYALGGVAFRRHFYERDLIPAGKASLQAEEQRSRWVPHVGMGAEWSVHSIALRLEADIFGDLDLDGLIPRAGRYADGFVSLGMSWKPR